MPLTDPKWEAFARSIAAGESHRQAALTAGYATKDASSRGSKLARKPEIAQRIAELRQMTAILTIASAQINKERVLTEYAKLAFLDIRKAFRADGSLIPITELDDDTAAAIAGLEVEQESQIARKPEKGTVTNPPATIVRLHKIKLSDKKGALDSLAKHLGMFVDRKEVTGLNGGPVLIQMLDSFLDDDGNAAAKGDGKPQKLRPVRS